MLPKRGEPPNLLLCDSIRTLLYNFEKQKTWSPLAFSWHYSASIMFQTPYPTPSPVPPSPAPPPVSTMSDQQDTIGDGNTVFVFIVLGLGFCCMCWLLCSRWRLRRQQQESTRQLTFQILHYHVAAREAVVAQQEDDLLRTKVLGVLFPEPSKDDCNHHHMIYDPEAKRYHWTNETLGESVTCSICLETVGM